MKDILTEKGKAMILNTIGNPLLTNCYLSCHEVLDKIAVHDIHCFCYEGIVILIHPIDDGIHKMYYFLEDHHCLIPDLVRKIRKDMENYRNLGGSVVARMPNRNVDVLEKLQFHPYKEYVRKQMIPGTEEWCEPEHVIETADVNDLYDIYELLHKSFDIMTDHLVSQGELRNFLEMSQVLKISIHGELAGVLLFEAFGKKSYLRSICVSEDYVGNKIGLSLLRGYFLKNRENTKLFYLWVESTNEKAIRLYERLGYKDDGLKEYTYLCR
ncbi:MAG: GNAT family N-acetyltransferase [Eubacterium sp.]|nr:GNAT family N-acetyltransferase [Eubacterium sp.]